MIKNISIITLLLVLFCSSPLMAQPAADGEPQILIKSAEHAFHRAVWSPDGQTIAVAAAQQAGIWITDADGNNLRQVTEDDAGYGFSWSADSRSLLARTSEYQNRRRKLAVKIYHTDTNEAVQLTEYRDEMPSLPVWANSDQKVVLINDYKVEAFESGKQVPERMKKPNQYFYVLKTDQIARGVAQGKTTGGVGKEDISPFEDATYLNLQVSPDGQKLSFEVYGGNLYVMNTDGSGLTDLGKGNRARWSPDSNYLVAMETEDDGHNFTRSDVIAIKADGTERINLTAESDLIAMNPSWAPDASAIIFDSPDTGAVYKLNIK